MIFIWSTDSLHDLHGIRKYIVQDNAIVAQQVINALMKGTESQLSVFPESGRPGRVKDSYIWSIPRLPYVVFYRLQKDEVHVLRVHHTSRHWPENFS